MLPDSKSPPYLWTGQLLNFTVLVVLLLITSAIWNALGRPQPILFWITIAIPIAHQLFVWIIWRSRLAGKHVCSFTTYLVIFFILFTARPISLIALGIIDRGSLSLPLSLRISLAILLALPALYGMYSVIRFFGFVRAAGADHFDSRYREMPLVTQGIFRYTRNGMYLYVFLIFWAIAIGFNSSLALLAAAFSHCYIWVHYFCTEKPDMKYLYSNSTATKTL